MDPRLILSLTMFFTGFLGCYAFRCFFIRYFCAAELIDRYFAVEFMTGGLFFVITYSMYGNSQVYPLLCLFFALTLVSFYDIQHRIIPNRLVLLGLTAFVYKLYVLRQSNLNAGLTVNYFNAVMMSVIGAMLGGGVVAVILILSRGGMGMGDVKLMALVGLIYGWQRALVVFFSAVALCGFYAAVMVLSSKLKLKSFLPFAPFITLGALVAIVFNQRVDHLLKLLNIA